MVDRLSKKDNRGFKRTTRMAERGMDKNEIMQAKLTKIAETQAKIGPYLPAHL